MLVRLKKHDLNKDVYLPIVAIWLILGFAFPVKVCSFMVT